MKVLFFSCWYPTRYNSSNGIFVKEHATAAVIGGNSVAVLALNVVADKKLFSVEKESYLDENKIPTHIIHLKSRFYKWIYINPVFMYWFVKRYFAKNILPSFKPDILHSNVISPAAIMGYWLSKKYNLPHVISEHWTELDKFMRKNVFASKGKRAYKSASAVVAVSKFLKKKLTKYLGSDETIHVIPNVVSKTIFSYKPKSKNDGLVFSAVASWIYPKVPSFFVNALAVIAAESATPITLHIVGDGLLLADIKQRAASLGFKIIFHEYQPKEKVAALFHQSDFFLHSSYDETFSVIIAEALLTGTPVVASNVGAVPELVNPSNGILTENTHHDWVNSIRKIMQIKFEHQKIREDFQDRFSYESIGEKFSNLYKAIVRN